jgi:hypothetical protein
MASSGRLKREPPDQKEFDGLVKLGEERPKDSRTASLFLISRFDLAYGAAHAFAVAALRWHDYRSDERYVVFQALQHTLGLQPDVWRVMDRAHGARNLADYGGQLLITDRLFEDIQVATSVVRDAVLRLSPVQPEA